MCRLAALVTSGGPPPPLSSLLFDPPHSLAQQARAPRQAHRADSVNVDGTGVAWWADDAPEPLRYVTDRPPWSDANLPWLAPRLRSRMQLALVRSATTGIPYGTAFVAPFPHGRLACAHNGWVGRYRERTARPLLDRLPDHLFSAYHGASDSLAVFLTVLAAAERDPGAGLPGALRAGVGEVMDVCAKEGADARLNVVVADGARVAAVRAALDERTDSLWTLEGGRRWQGAHLLASEPLDDDPAWTEVPRATLVELTPRGVTLTPAPELVRGP